MIFSKTTIALTTLTSMMALVQADPLKISNPTMGTTWKVNDTVFLQWTGNCDSMEDAAAKNVDVNLMTGAATALRFVTKLASIDCSGAETRKEFTIPSSVASGSYSLVVQTTPSSYSNVFNIEGANGAGATAGPAGTTAGAAAAAVGAANGASTLQTDTTSYPNGAASPLKNVKFTATASAVALAAVFVAAQLL